MFREVARLTAYIFFKIFYRTQYIGIRNIPAEGSVILFSNHISNADPFVLTCPIKRMVYFMAKEELFRNKLIANLISDVGAFPVKRGKGDIGAIKKSLEKLKMGGILCMFPEGTRRRGDIKPEAKPGLALLAIKAKCQVLPAAIIGVPRLFNKVKVIFGQPVDLSEYQDKELSTEDYTNISKSLMERVEKLKEGV